MNDLKNIAAMMVEKAAPTSSEPEQQDQTDAAAEDLEELDASIDDGLQDTTETEEELDDEGEDADEDEAGTEAEIVTLTIDGEDHEVSFDDLVQSYQIDGSARKRLQEATEMRKSAVEVGRQEGLASAQVEIETGRQEMQTARTELSELIALVGPNLFQPQVAQPDPAMERQDPLGYLSQMERWRGDQARLQNLQQNLVQQTQAQRDQVARQQTQVRDENRRQLMIKRPDLQAPEASAAFTKNVRTAQEAVGFTTEEVNAFPDHRGLMLLDMLGTFIARDTAGGLTPAQRVVQKGRKPMSPQATTYKRSAAQKQKRATTDKARATGDYRDVAKTLMVRKP